MKRLILFLLAALLASPLFAESLTGEQIMAEVRARLPLEPVRLTGFIRTRDGRRNVDRALISELHFGSPLPHIRYQVMDAFGDLVATAKIAWPGGEPHFQLFDENEEPVEDASLSDEISETGLTWSDLSLDFLWWPGAEITGRERVRTRSSHVIEIPAPPHQPALGGVRLWIDASALLAVRAELLGPDGERLKRIDVDSIVEIEDDVWMVKDLIIRDFANNRRMGVRFEEVELLEE
jgi:hypothetical protein